jgi:glutaminase
VYESASETNHRNREIARLLERHGRIDWDTLEALDLYTRQSSPQRVCLRPRGDGGDAGRRRREPAHRGLRVVDEGSSRRTLAVMATAGLYETSGDWFYDVGLSGKSGIGGGIVTVSPGKGALGMFGPRRDSAGNSVKGQLVARLLSRRLGLDLFASAPEPGARV